MFVADGIASPNHIAVFIWNLHLGLLVVCDHKARLSTSVVVLRVGDAWLVGVEKRSPHGFRCLWLVSPHSSRWIDSNLHRFLYV